MVLIWCCLFFYFLASVTADKKCWGMEDVRSRKDEFIRCQKSIIILKHLELYPKKYVSSHCARMQQLQICNGLYNICDKYDIDILAIIEKHIDMCYFNYKPLNVCIVFECIPGEVNILMDSTKFTKVKGSVYQALQLKGFLRCYIHGHISNITVSKSSAVISVRDENGTEVLAHCSERYGCRFYNKYWDSGSFSYTTSDYDGSAVEITVESTDATDFILKVEGGEYYRCQKGINIQQQEGDVLSSTNGTPIIDTLHDQIPEYCFLFIKDRKYYGCQRGLNIQQQEGDVLTSTNGEKYHRGQRGINIQQQERDVLTSTNDVGKYQWLSKESLPWVATVLSTLLSLVLTGVYVTQCLLQRKMKQDSMKAKSPPDPSSRRPIGNDYESPQLYMDVPV